MKNMTVKQVSLVFVAGLLFACNAKNEQSAAASTTDKEEIKKMIQAKEDEFAEIFNTGVLRNIGYYADDATSFLQNQAPLVGKAAIVAFLESDLASNTNKISFTTREVFPSNDGNMVVELGSFKVVDSTKSPVNTGNYMILFEKRDGKYYAVRDMSTSDGVSVR